MQYDRLIGQTIDNQFEVVARLGRGGSGVVYKARQLQVGRTVALKFFDLPIQSDDDYLERFRQEGRILSAMKHPGIMRCFMLGLYQNKIPYLVCEFLEGETLRGFLLRRGKLGWREATQVAIKVCEALAYGESCGVVHRDLKPENIMVGTAADGSLEVKVLDYGLARFSADLNKHVHTDTGVIIGTPAYMSPEQCLGARANAQSDIYSVGIVFFEMIDGKPPFEGSSSVALLSKHVNELPRRPDSLEADIPAGLLAIVSKALAKQPADRFHSAAEMAQSLQSLLAGETVNIGAPRWVANTRLGYLRACIAFLVVVFGFVIAFTCVWFALSDPGPLKPEFLSRFFVRDPKSLCEVADNLKWLRKFRAASLIYEAAAGKQGPTSLDRLSALGKSVACAQEGGESARSRSLCKVGLQQTLLLCNSADGAELAQQSAQWADEFSLQLLDEDTAWTTDGANEMAQTCAALIVFYQRQSARFSQSQPVESRAKNVYLLYLLLKSKARQVVLDAPERVSAFLRAAETTNNGAEQKRVLRVALKSMNAFPNAQQWGKILNDQLGRLASGSSPSSAMTFATLSAIGSLRYDLPTSQKRLLIEHALADSGRQEGWRELHVELEQFLKNNPAARDLTFLLSVIDAKMLCASGRESAAFSELCRAYYDPHRVAEDSIYLEQELRAQANRLLIADRAIELGRAVADMLNGKVRVPPDVGESLARAWLSRNQDRPRADQAMQELLKDPVVRIAPEPAMELLCLRGLLFGIVSNFKEADRCFKRCEEQAGLRVGQAFLVKLFARRAEVSIVRRDFASAKAYAQKALGLADLLGDSSRRKFCVYVLFVAKFCLGEVKFQDCYRDPGKYGVVVADIANAVAIKVSDYMMKKEDLQASKFLADKLFLSDDKSVGLPVRFSLVNAAGDLFEQFGELAKARQAYRKAAAIASAPGAEPVWKLWCRRKLLALDVRQGGVVTDKVVPGR